MQAHTEVLRTPFIHSLEDDGLVTLRAASIATKHWLHVFDMDATVPACHVFPPFTNPFKVKGSYRENGTKKARPVQSSAWSAILGKDVLPRDLVMSDMYGRKKLAVLLKSNNMWHSCVVQPDTAPVPAADLKKMAVSFVIITYDEDKHKRAATTGKKHGKQSGKHRSFNL